jgi:membrane protease YdiL (CAAX protease family)
MRTIPPAGRLYHFSPLDAAATGFYIAVPLVLAAMGGVIGPALREAFPDAVSATLAVELAFYALVGTLGFVAARRVVRRDLRILATRPWFTLLMVPAALMVMMIFTAILVAATGASQTSGNQLAVQDLVQQSPAWLVVPLIVIVGPFVEEYVFRHLLIGKLSRRLNIWLCCALSVLLFAGIHVVGREGLVTEALVPYLGWGVGLVAIYIWTGKNLMFSYFVHALKNLVAVLFIYAIPPELLEQVQQIAA